MCFFLPLNADGVFKIVMAVRFYLFAGVTVLALMFSTTSYADEYYSNGFKAYLDGDYSQAQSQWLQSAKQGHAKSMFNLGLLHEQGRVENANQDKAQEWYRLAGGAGYSPANYHLALSLLSSGDKTRENKKQALALMNKAAAAGFKPAIDYVDGGVNNASLTVKETSSQALKNLIAVKTDTNAVNQRYLSERWVISKKPSYWTIQMLAFNDERKVQNFIDEYELNTNAAYFKEQAGGEVLYKLVYGVYKTKIQADFARQNLAKDLVEHGPWLRTIESVQSAIKAK